MSFIIAVYVHEGIVLASDSRTTYSRTLQQNNGSTVQQIGIHTTNSTKKTFLCNNNIAISTCGDASVQGLPITGYIETFSRKHLTTDTDIAQVPQLLLNFFKDYNPIPNTNFIVAGYSTLGEQKQQKIYKVLLKDGAISEIQTSGMQGAIWDGEILVLTRLLQPVGLKKMMESITTFPRMRFYGTILHCKMLLILPDMQLTQQSKQCDFRMLSKL